LRSRLPPSSIDQSWGFCSFIFAKDALAQRWRNHELLLVNDLKQNPKHAEANDEPE